jgi:predicted O-methyltransferase YrrM
MEKATRRRGIAGPGSRWLIAVAGVAGLSVGTAAAALTDRLPLAVALLAVLTGVLGLLVLQRLKVLSDRLGRAAAKSAKAAEAAGRADRAAQRALAGTEQERAAAATRHKRVDAVLSSLRHQLNHDAINLSRAQMREVEGLHQLYGGFTPRAPMPSSGQWALNPTDLLALLHVIEQRRPAVVVELGSGTSSIWIGYALQRLGGRLISIDHEPQYAGNTRGMVAAHGLGAVVEVRDAPLRPIEVRGTSFDWYDVDALADVDGIDLLVVDGPPGSTGPMSRYPAVDMLRHKLSRTAAVFLDDLSRSDEQETLRRWTGENPGLTVQPTVVGQHGLLSYTRVGTPEQRAVEVG